MGWEDYINEFDPGVNSWEGWDAAPVAQDYSWSGYNPPAMNIPGAGVPTPGTEVPWTQNLLGALSGAAPGAFSILGQLLGRPAGSSPQLTTAQRALSNQAQGALSYMQPGANQLFNTGAGLLNQLGAQQTPAQQQQASILAALAPTAANLASGNVQIPPALQELVKKAYDPYVGDIAQQAIESARNRGFAGGADLLNSGPGGAIAGPALANAAGMQANSLLQAMLAFPQSAASIAGSFNQPVAQLNQTANSALQPQMAQAAGYQNAFNAYPYGQAYNQNLGANLGLAAGQAIAGGLYGGGIAGQQKANQDAYQKSVLAQMNPQMPNQNSIYTG